MSAETLMGRIPRLWFPRGHDLMKFNEMLGKPAHTGLRIHVVVLCTK